MLNARLTRVSTEELLAGYGEGLVVFLNVDTLMKLQRSEAYARVCRGADFVMADGKILVLASRFLGTPVEHKVSGSDFLGAFCAHHRDDPSVRVFLLGAGPGVAARAQERINARLGRQVVVGAHSPSYGFERDPAECADIVRLVNASGATVLAVGLGAPKQELWIAEHRALMPGVTRFLPVGATLDFEAGAVPRAPAWMSNSGLEWLYRLAHEPRRLWRRYLVEGPAVLRLIAQQKAGRYQDPFASAPDDSTETMTHTAGGRYA